MHGALSIEVVRFSSREGRRRRGASLVTESSGPGLSSCKTSKAPTTYRTRSVVIKFVIVLEGPTYTTDHGLVSGEGVELGSRVVRTLKVTEDDVVEFVAKARPYLAGRATKDLGKSRTRGDAGDWGGPGPEGGVHRESVSGEGGLSGFSRFRESRCPSSRFGPPPRLATESFSSGPGSPHDG